MKYGNDIEPQIIRCPECQTIQAAIVEQMFPWWAYVHKCVKCEYVIMESEWDEVKPFCHPK